MVDKISLRVSEFISKNPEAFISLKGDIKTI